MTGFCAGCAWVTWPVMGRSPLPSVFPASSFLPLLERSFSRCWSTDAVLLRFWAWLSQMPEPRPGLLPCPCHQCLCQAPFAPYPPHCSHCSSMNCLQLGCITVIMRCLQQNAVGSAGQNSRPEAQETAWSKGRYCPNWPWNPPGAPTGQPAPVSSYVPLPGSQEQRLKIREGLL